MALTSVGFRSLAVMLVLAIVVAAVVAKRLLFLDVSLHAASLSDPPSQSYLVILGVGDNRQTTWDGSMTATGATILNLQGWRFSDTDAISGTASWTMASRFAPALPSTDHGPMQENGLIVTVSAASAPVTFAVKMAQGNFGFSSTDVPFGASKSFLKGSVESTPNRTARRSQSPG